MLPRTRVLGDNLGGHQDILRVDARAIRLNFVSTVVMCMVTQGLLAVYAGRKRG